MSESIEGLVEGVLADHLAGDHVVHGGHRLLDAAAEIALLVAVAQLHGLALAGGGPGGDGGAAHGPALEDDLHLDRGVAAAVEDLAGEHGVDVGHALSSSVLHAQVSPVHVALLARRHDDDAAFGDRVAPAVFVGIVPDDRAPRDLHVRGR